MSFLACSRFREYFNIALIKVRYTAAWPTFLHKKALDDKKEEQAISLLNLNRFMTRVQIKLTAGYLLQIL
jgi:hypothetical protein